MATTYERIRAAVHHASRRAQWDSLTTLAQDIIDRKVAAFRRSAANDPKQVYVRLPTVRGVVIWARTFGLIEEDGNGQVRITTKGERSLSTDKDFALHIRAAAINYLDDVKLPFVDLKTVIDGIVLPEVPDAETLAERVAKRQPAPEISVADLRAVLFMLGKCGALSRKIRVFYGSKPGQA